jgi:phage gpG-like protein
MRPLSQFPIDLEKWRKAQEQIISTRLPRVAGAIAVKGILGNFRSESYNASSKWKPRKGGPRNRGRKLLVDSGRLRRSFRQKAAKGVVTVWTDTTYAQVHNEGMKVSGTASIPTHSRRTRKGKIATIKAHVRKINFTMPRRQFMPTPGQPLPTAWRKEIDDAAYKMFKEASAKAFGQ